MKKNERKAILEGYKNHSVNNEIEILRSKECGCYFCKKTFDARKVTEWEQNEGGRASAICPQCGMSTVIGDASGVPLSKELLTEMNKAFYGEADGEKNPRRLQDYVDHYLDGQIPHSKKNEDLFLSYCEALAQGGQAKAYLILGDFASGDARFRKPDPKAAYAYYSNPLVLNDMHALCERGRLAVDGYGDNENKMEGFECFSKAAALGSLEAVYLIADCYHHGRLVKKDDSFAIRAIIAGFRESYRATMDCKLHPNNLPEFAYRLGKCLQNGWGIEIDATLALKYYLICQFTGFMRMVTMNAVKPSFSDDLMAQINSLGAKINAKSGDPVFDLDTFFDTYGDPNTPDDSNKEFTLISYDEDSHELVFEIATEDPGFLIDTANLYCNLNKEKVRWTFTDVAYFTQTGETAFSDIVVTDAGYQFVRYDEESDQEILIAEIALTPDDGFEKETEEAGSFPGDEGE